MSILCIILYSSLFSHLNHLVIESKSQDLLLDLLYFFRFLFFYSFVGSEVCVLASHFHAFSFQSERRVNSLKTRGITKLLNWEVTISLGGVRTPLQAKSQVIYYFNCMLNYFFIFFWAFKDKMSTFIRMR